MATRQLTPVSDDRFEFKKDRAFLDGAADASIQIDVPQPQGLALAVSRNTQFPPGMVKLGTVKACVKGERAIAFGNGGRGSISFSGAAEAFQGLGVYESQQELMADLALRNPVIDGLNLGAIGAARYVALNWGYQMSGKASGSVALSPGITATFGTEGKRSAFFAVVRAFEEDPKAASAIAATLDSWRLPRQVPEKGLDPGVWILTEVNASIGVQLGAQLGYEYNWIRNVGLQGLSGAIGLRIQAAAEVTLGCSASGKFALVMGRESFDPGENKIRLRLYKLRQKGWQFALNTNVNVTPATGGLLPNQMDDFVGGIFGVSGPQIIEDLKVVRQWVDPRTPLENLASEFLVDFANKKLRGETGLDAKKIYTEAHSRILGFLDQWDNLGHHASSYLWSTIAGKDEAAARQLRRTIDALAGADDSAVADFVRDTIGRVDYFNRPAGRWLAAVAANRLVDVLANREEFQAVRAASKVAKDLLDGGVINHLVQYVNERLSLDAIRNADLQTMDKGLKRKLGEFLGGPVDALKLEEIRSAIDELLKKGGRLYAEGVKVLNRTYGFSVAYSYQKASTKTALIDAVVDLDKNQRMASVLREAIDGEFRKLLTTTSGVTLREAVLTHHIERRSHLQLTIPHLDFSSGRLDAAFARMEVREDNGRLFLYELQAESEFERRRWKSSLAASLDLAAGRESGLRRFGAPGERTPEATTSYVFRQAMKNMSVTHLKSQLRPLVPHYFKDEFGAEAGTLDFWASALDQLTDQLKDNGVHEIGNTLLSLEVALPGKVLLNWLKAPEKKNDPVYLDMSRRIQMALRRLVKFCFFEDIRNYGEVSGPAAAVLVYSCLPVSTAARLSASQGLRLNLPDDVYWQFNDPMAQVDLLPAMVAYPGAVQRLRFAIREIHDLLVNSPDMAGMAGFYTEDELQDIQRAALEAGMLSSGGGIPHLRGMLLRMENRVIRNAVSAGRQMARFVEKGAKDPDGALEALTKFGLELTAAFNADLFTNYVPKQNLQNLGLIVFLEASRALGGGLGEVEPVAVLDVCVLDDDAPFPPDGFLSSGALPQDIPIAQRIIDAD